MVKPCASFRDPLGVLNRLSVPHFQANQSSQNPRRSALTGHPRQGRRLVLRVPVPEELERLLAEYQVHKMNLLAKAPGPIGVNDCLEL